MVKNIFISLFILLIFTSSDSVTKNRIEARYHQDLQVEIQAEGISIYQNLLMFEEVATRDTFLLMRATMPEFPKKFKTKYLYEVIYEDTNLLIDFDNNPNFEVADKKLLNYPVRLLVSAKKIKTGANKK